MAEHLIPMQSHLLQPGMYVAELDRSWLHTPFIGQGLMITQQSQVQALQRHCNYVYVDPEKSEPGLFAASEHAAAGEAAETSTDPADAFGRLATARTGLESTVRELAQAIRLARREGRLDLRGIEIASAELTRVICADRDAALWLIHTDMQPGYLYRRAVGTAVISVVLGLQLGLDREALNQLAMGGLILDIGKIAVPVPILAKPARLNGAERAFVEQHVHRGLTMIKLHAQVPERVLEMVLGHHERIDGSGYPRKLRGTDIPLFARIAGIVDTFDALTLDRRYAAAISANSALHFLNSLRDIKFDAALVSELVHALGVFPTGTCVQLIDGSLGLVCSQNRDWPLRPRVVVVTNRDGDATQTLSVLDTGTHAHIARAMPPQSLELNRGSLERAVNQAVH